MSPTPYCCCHPHSPVPSPISFVPNPMTLSPVLYPCPQPCTPLPNLVSLSLPSCPCPQHLIPVPSPVLLPRSLLHTFVLSPVPLSPTPHPCLQPCTPIPSPMPMSFPCSHHSPASSAAAAWLSCPSRTAPRHPACSLQGMGTVGSGHWAHWGCRTQRQSAVLTWLGTAWGALDEMRLETLLQGESPTPVSPRPQGHVPFSGKTEAG